MAALMGVEGIVKEAVTEYQAKEVEEKVTEKITQKEKMLLERRQDVFLKGILNEIQDTFAKIRHFFS